MQQVVESVEELLRRDPALEAVETRIARGDAEAYRLKYEAAKVEVDILRSELQASQGRVETLLAFTSGRDTCTIFDKGDVIRDDLSLRQRNVIVARFPKDDEEKMPREEEKSSEARRLSTLMSEQTAAFDKFRKDVEGAVGAARLPERQAAMRLAETARALAETETELYKSRRAFKEEKERWEERDRDRIMYVDDLKMRLKAEAACARRAMEIELEAKMAESLLKKENAVRKAKEARDELIEQMEKFSIERSRYKERVRKLRKELGTLSRARARDVESFRRRLNT